jgi:hypothetical protein
MSCSIFQPTTARKARDLRPVAVPDADIDAF